MAVRNNQVLAVDYLIRQGASSNRVYNYNGNEYSILHTAVNDGNYEMVEVLLKTGMNADEINRSESLMNAVTPLFIATRNQFPHIMYLLVSYGANVNQYITNMRFTEKCTLLKRSMNSMMSEESTKLLIRLGATCFAGLTPQELITVEQIKNEIQMEKKPLVEKVKELRRDSSSFFSHLPKDVIDFLITPMVEDSSIRCLKKYSKK